MSVRRAERRAWGCWSRTGSKAQVGAGVDFVEVPDAGGEDEPHDKDVTAYMSDKDVTAYMSGRTPSRLDKECLRKLYEFHKQLKAYIQAEEVKLERRKSSKPALCIPVSLFSLERPKSSNPAICIPVSLFRLEGAKSSQGKPTLCIHTHTQTRPTHTHTHTHKARMDSTQSLVCVCVCVK